MALWACEYARERRLFEETFFVSLQDEGMGAPITALKDVADRIARAFGISKKVPPYPCVRELLLLLLLLLLLCRLASLRYSASI